MIKDVQVPCGYDNVKLNPYQTYFVKDHICNYKRLSNFYNTFLPIKIIVLKCVNIYLKFINTLGYVKETRILAESLTLGQIARRFFVPIKYSSHFRFHQS